MGCFTDAVAGTCYYKVLLSRALRVNDRVEKEYLSYQMQKVKHACSCALDMG